MLLFIKIDIFIVTQIYLFDKNLELHSKTNKAIKYVLTIDRQIQVQPIRVVKHHIQIQTEPSINKDNFDIGTKS